LVLAEVAAEELRGDVGIGRAGGMEQQARVGSLGSLAVGLAMIASAPVARAGEPPSRSPEPSSCQAQRIGSWWVVDTANFRVCSLHGPERAQEAARECERRRRDLVSRWMPGVDPPNWSPRCQVVLHASEAQYELAVGRGVGPSLGSSLVQPSAGPVTKRRIDLRGDRTDILVEALPHELCHVVLADRFRDRPAPLWFDEGVAILCDSPAKQRLHRRDFARGVDERRHFRTAELLALESYPGSRVDVFYGQCAELTHYLLTLDTPATMLRFLDRASIVGANQALAECYAIAGTAELDRTWRARQDAERVAFDLRTNKSK
jgi:hypothetical protein